MRTSTKQYISPALEQICIQYCAFGWKSVHLLTRKRKQRELRISNYALLLVVLQWHHGSEMVKQQVVHITKCIHWGRAKIMFYGVLQTTQCYFLLCLPVESDNHYAKHDHNFRLTMTQGTNTTECTWAKDGHEYPWQTNPHMEMCVHLPVNCAWVGFHTLMVCLCYAWMPLKQQQRKSRGHSLIHTRHHQWTIDFPLTVTQSWMNISARL